MLIYYVLIHFLRRQFYTNLHTMQLNTSISLLGFEQTVSFFAALSFFFFVFIYNAHLFK